MATHFFYYFIYTHIHNTSATFRKLIKKAFPFRFIQRRFVTVSAFNTNNIIVFLEKYV